MVLVLAVAVFPLAHMLSTWRHTAASWYIATTLESSMETSRESGTGFEAGEARYGRIGSSPIRRRPTDFRKHIAWRQISQAMKRAKNRNYSNQNKSTQNPAQSRVDQLHPGFLALCEAASAAFKEKTVRQGSISVIGILRQLTWVLNARFDENRVHNSVPTFARREAKKHRESEAHGDSRT